MEKLKNQLFLFLILISIFGCRSGVFDRKCKQDIREIIFYNGLRNLSTGPDFIIFTALDINSNKTKEICCESTDLYDALVNEHSENYVQALMIRKPCREVFKFKTKYSLERIGFEKYNTKIVDSLDKVLPDSLFEIIRQNTLKNNYKLVWYYDSLYPPKNCFQHLLLRHNIPCYRDCETGYTVTRKIKSGT